jgi:hypothetical protein
MKHFGLYERDNKQKPFYMPSEFVIVGVPGRPVHDENSHGADALRGPAVCIDKITNEAWEMAGKRARLFR